MTKMSRYGRTDVTNGRRDVTDIWTERCVSWNIILDKNMVVQGINKRMTIW